MLGTVSANAATLARLKNTVRHTGQCEGPDDVYLGLRGLRTLAIRLERHQQSGLAIARWLERRPEVLRLLHPALPSHPGHAIWKRDFSGASGLFSMVLKPVPQKAYYAFLDTLELFGIGASWGGYESLAIPFDCAPLRTATRWQPGGPTVRFHIGLEAVDDLIADLERGFAALAAAAQQLAATKGSGRGCRDLAITHHKIKIAQVNEYAERLAGDEDHVLAVERIDQKQNSAADREQPERHRNDAMAGALRGDPLHQKARREQRLGNEDRATPTNPIG